MNGRDEREGKDDEGRKNNWQEDNENLVMKDVG